MHGWTRRLMVFLMVAALVCTAPGFSAFAQDRDEETTAEWMIADFVLLRPLGIAATATGLAFFIASLPFSALSGSTKTAFKKMVAEPASFTFVRPLGKVD